MRLVFAIATVMLIASGCSWRDAIREEAAPIQRRVEDIGKRLDSLEKKVESKLPSGAETTAPEAGEAASRLVGTWISEEVQTAVGPTVNTVTFGSDGKVVIETESTLPLMGHLRTTEGPYTVEGDTLHSESIEGGTKVRFRFEGDDLLIETKDGNTIRLRRR